MNAKLMLLLIAGGGLYGYQAGYIDVPSQPGTGGGIGLGDSSIAVYWEKDGEPPSCAPEGEGFEIAAIARDADLRLDQDGTFRFQWRSEDGWQDFARDAVECSQQTGVSDPALFCTVSTSYSVTEETAVNGEVSVRAQLEFGDQTATTPVRSTRIAGEEGC